MSSDPKRASGGVAFEVEVETNGDGATTPRGSMPKHITDRLVEAERPTTPDTIQKKQQLAEERRKVSFSAASMKKKLREILFSIFKVVE